MMGSKTPVCRAQRKDNEREELLREIKILRSTIRKLENVEPCDFDEIRRISDAPLFPEEKGERMEEIGDVQLALELNLYKFSGLYCTKFDDRYTFQFSASGRVTRDRTFAVQVLNENGRGRLGNWVLPMSVDVEEVLSKYPIDDFRNLKSFLRNIKHLIQCYRSREDQYKELKDTTAEFANCRVEGNLGYTRITVEMFGIKKPCDVRSYDAAVYMFYEPDEGRPYKLTIDLPDRDELSDTLAKELQKYFKPFRKFNMKDAFRKIIDSETTFFWKPVEKDIDIAKTDWNTSERNDSRGRERTGEGDEYPDGENAIDLSRQEEENSANGTEKEVDVSKRGTDARRMKPRKRKSSAGVGNQASVKKRRKLK